MLRWYGRRDGRRRPRLVGCLIWFIALVVILIVLSLLFGGFTKGTKVSGLGPQVPLAAAQHATPPPR
jgi:ABC-type transporter Mla maintaining outer membrane lipid asymmetry permease subunit MlaE